MFAAAVAAVAAAVADVAVDFCGNQRISTYYWDTHGLRSLTNVNCSVVDAFVDFAAAAADEAAAGKID